MKRGVAGKVDAWSTPGLKRKRLPRRTAQFIKSCVVLALAGFEPALRFVDHINAAFATHNAAITVPVLERAEGIANFHVLLLSVMARTSAGVAGGPRGDQ